MSIKIYNGWNLGLVDVFDIRDKVDTVFRPVLLQRTNEEALNEAILLHDKVSYDNGRFIAHVNHLAEKHNIFRFRPESVGTYTWNDFYRLAREKQKEEREQFSLSANVEVVYLRHPETKETYCFVYGDNEMLELFEETFGEPFQYWNNSDHPDELTEEEWKGRLKTWEKVLNLDRPALTQGLSQEVLGSFDLVPRLSYLESGGPVNMVTIDGRAKALASACADAEHFEEIKAKGEEIRFSYFTSNKRRKRVALLKDQISATLEEISLEDLIEEMSPKHRKR